MNTIEKVVCFKVYPPHASEVYRYRFELMRSEAFRYGNGTCVVIYRDGELLGYLDTRYDKSVTKNLSQWCVEWVVNRYSSSVGIVDDDEYMEVFYCEV